MLREESYFLTSYFILFSKKNVIARTLHFMQISIVHFNFFNAVINLTSESEYINIFLDILISFFIIT